MILFMIGLFLGAMMGVFFMSLAMISYKQIPDRSMYSG